MKKVIMFLVLVLVITQTFGQRKSKVDPKDVQIDSLTKYSKQLTLQLDSVNKELVKYVGLYNTIKDSIIHYNFDPTRSAYLIDSLKTSRDSTFALLASSKSTANPDSIQILIKENTTLKAAVDSLSKTSGMGSAANSQEDIEKTKAINDLKQLKELYDNKIISEAEFNSMKKKYLEKL